MPCQSEWLPLDSSWLVIQAVCAGDSCVLGFSSSPTSRALMERHFPGGQHIKTGGDPNYWFFGQTSLTFFVCLRDWGPGSIIFTKISFAIVFHHLTSPSHSYRNEVKGTAFLSSVQLVVTSFEIRTPAFIFSQNKNISKHKLLRPFRSINLKSQHAQKTCMIFLIQVFLTLTFHRTFPVGSGIPHTTNISHNPFLSAMSYLTRPWFTA